MAGRRGGTLAILSLAGLATGVSFAAGSHLRERFSDHYLGGGSTRLAQAQSSRSIARGAGGALMVRPDKDDDHVKSLDTFYEVYDLVKEHYVDKLPDERTLAQSTVRGMLTELNDPNCRFLEPAERQAWVSEEHGTFSGIGAALRIMPSKRDGYTEQRIMVVAPMPGSPAEKAGLKSGDVITSVDGKYVLTSNPLVELDKISKRIDAGEATEEEVEKAIEGAEAAQKRIAGGITIVNALKKITAGTGEKRILAVQRPGVAQPISAQVTTALTKVAPLTTKTLPGGTAYIKISAFTNRTGAAFKEALSSLPKQSGLVLDLRGNPGGSRSSIREVASLLTPGGSLLLEVNGRGKRAAIASTAPRNQAARPVVVLVDRGTASYAEALAVALRDKGVATLVGKRTFGDALVRKMYALPDGSGYTLTTGKLLGPTGADWHLVGLAPGVALADTMTEDQVIARAVSALRSRAHIAAAPARS